MSWATEQEVLREYRMLSSVEAVRRQILLSAILGSLIALTYLRFPFLSKCMTILSLSLIIYYIFGSFIDKELLFGIVEIPPASTSDDGKEAFYNDSSQSRPTLFIRMFSSDSGFIILKFILSLIASLPFYFLLDLSNSLYAAAAQIFVINGGAIYFAIKEFLDYIRRQEIDEFPSLLKDQLMSRFNKIFNDSRGYYFIGTINGKRIGIPRMGRFMHTLIGGPTGSQKSTTLIIPPLLFDAESIGSAVVPDAKSPELFNWVAGRWQKFGKRVFLFDPWHAQTVGINFLPDADDNDLLTIVEVMMREKEEAIGKEDPFFKSRTRYLLYAVLKLVQSFDNDYCNLSSVYHIMESSITLEKFIKTASQPLQNLFSDYMLLSAETRINALTSIRNKLDIFMDADVRKAFSKSEFKLQMLFAENTPCLLVLGAPVDRKEPGQKIASLIVNLIINMAFRERRLHKQALQSGVKSFVPNDLYLYLDELRSLKITGLADLVSIARETKTHVIGSVTDYGFLKYYGPDYTSLMGNFRNRIVMRGLDYDSAKYISDSLGKHNVATYRFFRTIMAGQENRNLIDPNEVTELPEDKIIIFTSKTKPFVANKMSIYSSPWLKAMQCPAPQNMRSLYREWEVSVDELTDSILPVVNGDYDFNKIRSDKPVQIDPSINVERFNEKGGGTYSPPRTDNKASSLIEENPGDSQPQTKQDDDYDAVVSF